MGYLEECLAEINQRDFPKFLELWEEYCTSDTVDIEECSQLLEAIKNSDFARPFGQLVEMGLPLWHRIPDEKGAYQIGRLLIDLQTTNSPVLQELALDLLKKKYSSDPLFNERLRLVNLRGNDNFQGAVSNYDLLAHMKVGKFVFHTAGWGVGEIVDLSSLREQVTIEFEHVPGRKHLNFANAFKTLIPIPDEHFLARRFGDSDKLEEEAKKDPVGVIKMLLKDLGPRTAGEFKDELCDLVIPEKEWAKWWQMARSKLKKDTMVQVPETLRDPFLLRKAELLHEERLLKAMHAIMDPNELILTSFNFVRDFPQVLKNSEIKEIIQEKLIALLEEPDLNEAQEIQIRIFLENQLSVKLKDKKVEEIILPPANIQRILDDILIAAYKRRMLMLVKANRKDWVDVFLSILFSNQQSYVREYLFKELNQPETRQLLAERLKVMQRNPKDNPDAFFWYYQLLVGKEESSLPLGSKEELPHWFEAFLILYQFLEFKPEWRELSKKMYMQIQGKRYAMVRQVLEGTSLEFVNEFLLLVSKCQSLTDTDQQILRSLAAVVHPSLAKAKPSAAVAHMEDNTLWTTEEGYLRTQERIREIGTTEMVANAKEVEAARALGDLRENSEYKFALEMRARLQGEMKALSEQIGRARIITPVDVKSDEISIGSIVEIVDSKGTKTMFTILGPWDADADNQILSSQSKFVQAMLGLSKDDRFNFRNEDYKILRLKTIFDTDKT
ncbi:MAG: GreA/GreB family elongation factor [Parachlamydiaceae bacterium]|nr:GreA/GreB family elongation factor [Parachlamydiaceae bacterium]